MLHFTPRGKGMKRNSYIVLLQLLNGEFCLHQVVVEDDDLSAQRALLIVMVLRLIKKKNHHNTFFQIDIDGFGSALLNHASQFLQLSCSEA